MNMMFKKQIFDEREQYKEFEKLEQKAREFEKAIEVLTNEGLPTDIQTITKITASDSAYADYLNSLKAKQLDGKTLLSFQIDRVNIDFMELLERTNEAVNYIRLCIVDGMPIIDKGETVSIDADELEKLAIKKATYNYDVKAMQDHYNKVQAVIDSLKELREYEKSNSLPDATFNPSSFNTIGVYIPSHYQTNEFAKRYDTPEKFQEVLGNYFKKQL